MNAVMHQDRRPAQPARSSEAGFALIEVIVSAVVLAIVALAVLSGLDGAANGAARERTRSVAASIAEQDQERLRAMRAEDLGEFAQTTEKTIDGITYTIRSEGEWISDSTGGTTSCTNNEDQVDYIKITTTVSSEVVGRRTAPTTITGLVAPPAGRARGTLAVQVVDRNADPVVGLRVYVERANPDTEFSTDDEVTNEVGCAVFPRIPIGNYQVELREPGWVNRDGINPASVGTTVNNGAVTLETIEFDRAGTINVSFDTVDPRNADAPLDSRGLYARVFHADMTDRDASGGTLASTIGVGSLFPFPSAYGVYAGRCGASEPPSSYFESHPGASALVGPGATTPIKVRQPPLRIRVGRDNNAGNTNPAVQPGTFTPSQGTIVKARLTDGSCSEQYLDLTTTSSATTSQAGWVTKPAATGYAYDPGVPFGTWSICAQVRNASNNWRYANYSVAVGETGSARLWLEPLTQGNISGQCP
jgi:type II secretory pathway pseudopilin PulG